MPRRKAIETQMRELAKTLSPEQMKQLADLLSAEAERPRFDKKQYAKLQRDMKTAYARLMNAEEKLSVFLSEAGKANDEINDEINELRRQSERDRLSAPGGNGTGRGRGRRKKVQPEE